MKIVIVDDNMLFGEKVSDAVKGYFDLLHKRVSVDLFSNGHQLLNSLVNNVNYDIYLLDVEMPEIGGLDLAEKIRKQDKTGYIIFITNHEKYAVMGYKYHIYQYILKNQFQQDFPNILGEIYSKMEEQECGYYVIQTSSRYERFHLREIQYLVKEGKNIVFYCNSAEYKERTTIEQVCEQLPQNDFVLIDRGQIVNMNYVTRFSRQEIELNSEKVFHVSRNMLTEVKHKLALFWSDKQ